MAEDSGVLAEQIRETRCPECKEAFKYQYQLTETNKNDQPLWVDMACRWCKAELSVEIRQFIGLEIHKGDDDPTSTHALHRLPSELLAKKRDEKGEV